MDILKEPFAVNFASSDDGPQASAQSVFPAASSHAFQDSTSISTLQSAALLALLLLLIGCLA